jgi:putative flavoprotein involved in K+ transport
MGKQLNKRGLAHLVAERHRIAERWRSERRDGLRANGAARHDSLPGLPSPVSIPTASRCATYGGQFSILAEPDSSTGRLRRGVDSIARDSRWGSFCAEAPAHLQLPPTPH